MGNFFGREFFTLKTKKDDPKRRIRAEKARKDPKMPVFAKQIAWHLFWSLLPREKACKHYVCRFFYLN